MSSRPRVDLPRHTWRALHSAFMDWLMKAPAEIAEAMMHRLGNQVSFEHFVMNVYFHQRLDVYVRTDEAERVRIGIRVQVADGDDWLLFDLPESEAGVDQDWLIKAGMLRLDEELQTLLGGNDEA